MAGRGGRAACLIMVLAAALTAGCVNPPDGIEVVKGRELDDIPVKENLEFVGSETYVPALAEGTKFRSWVGTYRGRGLLQEIGPWYVGAMKANGWEFTGVVESKGPCFTYSFIKRDEEAEIKVSREYAAATGQSINVVRAEVHPRGTESFLPEDLETMKATGVAWAEPGDEKVGEVETISFTEEIEVELPPATTTDGPSEFLLEDETGLNETDLDETGLNETDLDESVFETDGTESPRIP